MAERLPTVEEVIRELNKHPPNFQVLAYKGEGGNGLIIKDPEGKAESGWIPTNEK